uniref:Sema domain-containing protein n=1 Tax=Anser brachyrhynchus TaxID=132585 RepID=A0A8B9CPS4_9AVES
PSSPAAALPALLLVFPQCPRIPYSSTRNFSVPYTLPSFDAGGPVQNVAVFADPATVFVAVRNRILVAGPELRLRSVLITGPTGSAECEICRLCPAAAGGPGSEDVDNILLLLDPQEPWLYSCGTARHGLCYQHQLEVRGSEVTIVATHCLYSATGNSPASCPDCVASPLGTSGTVVADHYSSFFYLGSSVNSSVAARYSPQSVSVRRLKGTLDGFADTFQWLTVLPPYRDAYPIHYVHSFTDGEHVYFLTVQPECPGSASYHTRLARLSTSEHDLRRYRELVLDCRFESKRRRRSAEEDTERDVAYNVLQAAHATRPGERLARDLGIDSSEMVLFGAFAESQPESPAPQDNSAVCAFPLRLLNQAIEEGMDKCCGTGAQTLRRGRGEARHSRISSFSRQRVDLFNGRLAGILLTSIFVSVLENVTVAHLGTAQGRILQVGPRSPPRCRWTRCSSPLPPSPPCPLLTSIRCPQVWRVNVTGPGCRHFLTCDRCLRAERFMGCGWCGDGCARSHECNGTWVQDSCPPILTDVGPRRCPWPRGDLLESGRGVGREVEHEATCGGTLPQVGHRAHWGGSSPCTLHPSFGPQGGGTLLSLCGTHLLAGSSWEVTVNGSKCPLAGQPRYAPAITPASVALWIDGEEFPAPLPFQYRPNPSVWGIVPNCSYG